MSPYETLLASLGVTVGLAVLVAGYLDRPMWRILVAGCGSKTPAVFWSSAFRVLLVVTPVCVQLIVAPTSPAKFSGEWAADLLDQAKWGLVGEVSAVLLVAVGVGFVVGSRNSPVWVDSDDADDLRRLVEHVRVTRARELVARADGRRGR